MTSYDLLQRSSIFTCQSKTFEVWLLKKVYNAVTYSIWVSEITSKTSSLKSSLSYSIATRNTKMIRVWA